MIEAPTYPAGEAQVDSDNPWPGLESYDESSHHFFSGRTLETDELQRRILDEPITVLFGKSGLGKTSLLKAGVFPRLRDKGLCPIIVRLQPRPGAQPLTEQARLAFFEALGAQRIEHLEPAAGETLWEYLHRTGQELWTSRNRLVQPVFVFDQFEELFTLGRAVPAEVEAFREELADLAENRIPAALARRLEHRAATEQGLDVRAMRYKIVIALREDFLADLEGWRLTMPSLRRNRMRLLPLAPEQALEAVWNERTAHLVSEPLARTIVDFLSSGAASDDHRAREGTERTVEPALLSLFCRGVNEHRKRDGKAGFDKALIDGGKGTIVSDFYRASLEDQPDTVRRFIAEQLVTEHGFRNSYSVDDALARGFVTGKQLATLVNRHLLRQEHHLGADRIELTHDLLTRAVVEERDQRRRLEHGRRQRRKMLVVLGVFAIVALGSTGAAVLALRARNAAVERNVEIQRLQAKTTRQLTELETAHATLQRALADVARQTENADTERRRARSQQLAALAVTAMSKSPERAIALARESLHTMPTPEARSALLDAARYAWPGAVLDERALGGRPRAIALSPDGNRLAVVAGGMVSLWDVSSRTARMAWPRRVALGDPSSAAFSPDQTRLAVASKASVDLLDTNTGDVVRRWPFAEAPDRQIVFSADGQWLTTTQYDGFLHLLDYRGERAGEKIAAPGIEAFTVLPGGQQIIGVTTSPLAAHALRRQPGGDWKGEPVSLAACTVPHSISPGPDYFSATFRARMCVFRPREDGTFFPDTIDTEDRPTADIIWSSAGRAFVELLTSPEGDSIIVRPAAEAGGDATVAAVIKGSGGIEDENDKSRSITVSDRGTRVALLHEHVVKVFSLAEHKLFLSRLEGPSAVAPDGSWIAVTRRSAPGDPSAVIEVIPTERAFATDYPSRAGTRITVEALPSQLYAARTSLVAVVPAAAPRRGRGGAVTRVFDPITGQPRFDGQPGRARPLGAGAELLLIESSDAQPWRVIRTQDGSAVAPWERSPRMERPRGFIVSPGNAALAVLPAPATTTKARALVYAVSGDTLVPAGELDVPSIALSGLTLADDARRLTARRRESNLPLLSPRTGFELHEVSPAREGARTVQLVRRADNAVLKTFPSETLQHRFSDDDHWLVAWSEAVIQVIDLARGETAFELNPGRVRNVGFEGRNTLLNVVLDQGTMLVPLDRTLMERFATWLAPRALTALERCMYGLGGDECRKELIAPRAQAAYGGRATPQSSP